jgi:hypothetical protein
MGRKRLRLIDDPDRYEIVLIDALIAHRLDSEHTCIKYLTRLLIGIKGEANGTRHGSNAGTIRGRMATLRAKRRRYRSTADIHWRTIMSAAFQAGFTLASRDRQQAKIVALAAAKIVGEAEFAYRVLWPMIDNEA